MKNQYIFHVSWSEKDQQYVGVCEKFPSLSWLADSEEEALSGIKKLVDEVLLDM